MIVMRELIDKMYLMTLKKSKKKQINLLNTNRKLELNRSIGLILPLIALICIFNLNLSNYLTKSEIVLNRPVANEKCTQVYTKEFEIPKTWVVTGYCHCEICCGVYAKTQGEVIRGASGNELISGYSCASSLPFGTILEVQFSDGHKELKRVDDRGTSGNHLDLYYSTHAEALSVGYQMVGVRIVE